MNLVKFIPSKSHNWINYNIKNFNIWITSDNEIKIIKNIIESLNKAKLIDHHFIKNLLNNINGHFRLLVIHKDWAFSAVDVCRSYPIFWKETEKGFILSNQAKTIADNHESKINSNQRLSFQMSGYTIGDSTLWSEIKNMNCGEFIIFKKNNMYVNYKHFTYKPWIKNELKHKKLKSMLKIKISEILKNLIKQANGRTIAIPLSAGLDSRLIASGLKQMGYINVKCFSYGLKNNFESKASKRISEALGFKWQFVEININSAEKYYRSKEYSNFFYSCNDGCATPGIQDAYVTKYLIDSGFLKKDDLIVNGNSGDFISGGHIPNIANDWDKEINKIEVIDIIFKEHYAKHYSLWRKLLNNSNKIIIKNEIKKQISNIAIKDDKKVMPHGILESIEYENRQAKYVINFQRVYDYYKLKWALPLWDKSFIEFWAKVPLKYKIKQNLYKEVLKELNMGGVWTKDYNFKYKISPYWISIIRSILKVPFIILGKNRWHNFDNKFISYWTDILGGQCIMPYSAIIKNKNGPRHFVAWHTLYAEQKALKNNWQNLKINKLNE